MNTESRLLHILPPNSVAEIKHLKKSFDGKTVLRDISFTLFKGENLVILGKSGTGKSVLIKCLVGLDSPENGDILVLGRNLIAMTPRELNQLRKKIGFLFQSGALYDSMSVRDNLLFTLLRNTKLEDEMAMNMVYEALKDVDLVDAIDKMPSELSGGMRKRVGLARALILKPQIMLYDEPTTGLDPGTSKEINALILKVQKNYHTSSIIITHDITCARSTANRILVLKDGIFIAEGSIDEMENSENEYIQSFFL